jgi:hypothetical protein
MDATMSQTSDGMNASGPEELSSTSGSTTTLPVPVPQPRARITANSSDMIEVGAMLFQEAEQLLRTGQKRRIRVRLGRKTLAEIPLASGALGVMAAAMLAVALTRLTLELE